MARRLTLTLGVLGGMTRAVSMGASPTFTVLAPRVSGIVSRQVQGGFPTTGALVKHPPLVPEATSSLCSILLLAGLACLSEEMPSAALNDR